MQTARRRLLLVLGAVAVVGALVAAGAYVQSRGNRERAGSSDIGALGIVGPTATPTTTSEPRSTPIDTLDPCGLTRTCLETFEPSRGGSPDDNDYWHPSYECCLPRGVDHDCANNPYGPDDGPEFVYEPIEVYDHPDEYDLDRDGNGVGCEEDPGG